MTPKQYALLADLAASAETYRVRDLAVPVRVTAAELRTMGYVSFADVNAIIVVTDEGRAALG